ncbi:glycosyl hydrolase family 17 protein [Algibacter mikhailovii]|uniref:glycosyl hydrolase family 17 protein n=1 Tax=Algibacter mikhailovii TaxID=425498 RepID=UPI0024955913|nr:glycosyl hydrolase family 17 protein [Algibacter mikhailovii]
MIFNIKKIGLLTALIAVLGCANKVKKQNEKVIEEKHITAADILGNPDYQAISYGGYRQKSREIQPTIPQLKEDMKILSAMGIRVLRTYNVQIPLPHASNLLKAISELKKEDPSFEMYVMLGAWIDCQNAWTDLPVNHEVEADYNEAEIDRAVALANKYPDIVKIIAVGNEAMIRWATSYFVRPNVILKWVNHLQGLKNSGKLPKDLWITSSDDFASWGGGDPSYHTPELEALIKSVDYISMHTYPMHNSHYNPAFWIAPKDENHLSEIEKIESAMIRARDFAINQYDEVSNYMKSLGVDKPIHIGETGWATVSNGHYGVSGSKAADEYKSGRYYQLMREWSNKEGVSCFYFEAFDEQWKDAKNSLGSENHFGLINLKGEAKYGLWKLVDQGVFDGLTRDGQEIIKTYGGDKASLLNDVLVPPSEYGLVPQH